MLEKRGGSTLAAIEGQIAGVHLLARKPRVRPSDPHSACSCADSGVTLTADG